MRKRLIHDQRISVRRAATKALAGAYTPTSTRLLIKCLKDADAKIRILAARGFYHTHLEPAIVVPALVDALGDKDANVCFQAAVSLTTYGRKAAQPAVPVLVEVLKGKNSEYVRTAAEGLGDIGCYARTAVPVLVDTFQDGQKYLGARCAAARALSEIGSEAVDAVPALIGGLQDNDNAIRYCSAIALAHISPRDGKLAVPALVKALEELYPSEAIESLATIGPEAKDAVPALIEMRNSGRNQYDAEAAVRKIDPDAARRAGI